ncbi:MAG: hypothetical protein J1F07_03250 [Muribaculaceae bacterium]|nr:hypothetical protein [Muribaculaceae bacterium]
MKNSVRLLLILLSGIVFNIPLYAQEHAKKKVAVYMTGTTSDEAYKKVIGAKLVNAITESGEYAAVERTADFLAALSAESDYQTSGEVRDSQIARLGQKFGVRYVVVADASELFDEYFIAARLINVETGLVERAFDINGPADSMSQLVALSQKVAQGLLNTSGRSYISGVSKEPLNMSLCAIKDHNLVFITATEWEKLGEQEKAKFEKKGICILNNGEAFVVSLRDSPSGDWHYAKSNHAPTTDQLEIIYNNIGQLNSILRYFGGKPMDREKDTYYWTCKEGPHSRYGLSITMCDGSFAGHDKIYSGNINRPVYKIQEIIQESPLLWK